MSFEFRLRTWPDSILCEKCKPLPLGVDEPIPGYEFPLDQLREQMIAFCVSYNGLGLAANQLGVPVQIFVMRNPSNMSQVTAFINPEIMERMGKHLKVFEECLSFPGKKVRNYRREKVLVEFYDKGFNRIVKTYSGLESVCIQHEIDHLKGITMLDRHKKQKRKGK